MTSSRTNPTPQQAAAQATKPQFFVMPGTSILYYQAKAGDEIQFDLDFPGEVLDALYADDADFSQRQEFFMMVEGAGGKKLLDRVKKMGALEQTRLMIKFLEIFQREAGATLGESDGSSDT